ncbi:hypothetical protein L2W58_12765 [Dethiosulfovibrio sp. F2B]|uniref:hypothetical protein n=1 Tax=Dethiosulfovibrio faecalis TaxID=2720018 RepID=UPI001F2C50C4|nr:hypothetical protein [Dethiosulfovibrio faecalis]MCF4152670.1 hypothetical protein [Dethiosulfovibrio faecalis]
MILMFLGPVIMTAAVSALVTAIGLKLACRGMFGVAPSYGNAWLAAFAGAVAASVLTPMLGSVLHMWFGGFLGFGLVAFFVQAAVFKGILRLPGGRGLSFGESCLASLLAVLILMVLSFLLKAILGISFLAGGTCFL